MGPRPQSDFRLWLALVGMLAFGCGIVWWDAGRPDASSGIALVTGFAIAIIATAAMVWHILGGSD